MFNVLFIDDDSSMLHALQRMAKRLKPEWNFLAEQDASRWNKLLTEQIKLDLVICDYQMPNMNGVKVLAEVSQTQPSAIRALLTGDPTEEVILTSGKIAHFILSKPFNEQDIVYLFTCIERIHALPFSNSVREILIASSSLLPQPDLVKQVRVILENDKFRVSDIIAVISHDPLIVARILQLSNSAFFGFNKSTLSIEEAVKRLGVRLTCNIISAIAVEQATAALLERAEHIRINEHAFSVASYTKRLGELLDLSKGVQEELFATALLSAIGELVISTSIWQGKYANTFADWPRYKLTAAVSAYFLTSWGYSEQVCQTLLWSAAPNWVYSRQNLSLLLFLAKCAAENNGKIPPNVLDLFSDPQLRQQLQEL
ncbi:HDOD domain-containing protein [Rheinheimera aquimaris]|uniref:HDOD domain-containing protein n=1 Tax=Rheinheimera aquimaris TaxID=412437 RepID=A0ABN1DV90_9GAMM|nr:HDOD domain-containing protein [Rheinheimera aquimaris]MCB5213989.1 HDOD domain-containing protein [Rheinheimera aquimaris]